METLPKAITRTFFETEEGYAQLKARWSALVNSEARHTLRAEHHLLYAMLRGKDYRRGFTEVTNAIKLLNGARAGQRLYRAVSAVKCVSCEDELLEPFRGIVTPRGLRELRKYVPWAATHNRNTAAYQEVAVAAAA